jgi:hypothetical protein
MERSFSRPLHAIRSKRTFNAMDCAMRIVRSMTYAAAECKAQRYC